jgi:hypothetical protein
MKSTTSRCGRRSVAAAARSCVELLELEPRRLLSASLSGAPAWVSEGPGPIHGGQAFEQFTLTADVAGAIATIAADPLNSNRVFVGAVNGGIWRTNNAQAVHPNWTPLTDQLPSLSIGDIKISPLDSNVIYAGIGQFSSNSGFNFGGGLLSGVLRSIDGGNTWAQLGRSQLGGFSVTRIVPTSTGTSVGNQVVLASTTGGVFRSPDGGLTWNNLSGTGSGLPGGGASDLVADPGVAGRLYVGIPGAGVFRSINNGVSWSSINNDIVGATATARIRLTVQPNPSSTRNVVWAGFIANTPNSRFQVSGIFRSPGGTDGSDNDGDGLTDEADEATWTAMGPISDVHGPTLHNGGQALTHFSMLADRTDANVVFVGGDRQLPFGLELNATGRLFRGDASRTFGSGQWDSIVNLGAGGALGGSAPHADSRDMVFDADGNILEADDGGIWRLLGPNNHPLFRLWHPIHGDIQPTEFNSVAYDAFNHVLLGGAQDVGSSIQDAQDSSSWSEDFTRQADGGMVAASSGSDFLGSFAIHYTTVQSLQFFQRRIARFGALPELVGMNVAGSGGLTLLSTVPSGTNTVGFDGGLQFYNPYVLNVVNSNRMLIGTSSLYESFDRGDNLNPIGGVATTPSRPARVFGSVTTMSYGGFADTNSDGLAEAFPEVAWVGTSATGSGLFLRTAAPATPTTDNFAPVTAFNTASGTGVTDLTIDPVDWRRAYVLDANNAVWFTPNAGASWVNLSSNLSQLVGTMNLPLNMRSIALYVRRSPSGPNDDTLLVGGVGGVFRAIVTPGSSAVTWTKFGLGLANATVTDLQVSAADDLVIAGTAGRGAWKMGNLFPSIRTPGVLTINGDDGGVRDDNIRLVRNAANPLLLDVFLNSSAPVMTIPFSVPQRIAINGLGGDDTLTLDFSNGSFVPAGGISYDGGTNTTVPGDGLVVIGAPTLNGTYNTSGAITVGGGTITFTNLEPVTVSGFGSFALETDGGPDVIGIDSPAAGVNRISGTTDGRAFESFSFSEVSSITLDLASNDTSAAGADEVILHTPGLVASGLGNFDVNVGSGDDKFTVDAPGAVETGALALSGGSGVNRLTVTGEGDFLVEKDVVRLSGLSGGLFRFADLAQLTLIGGKVENVFTINGFSGNVAIDGMEGVDRLILEERKAPGSSYFIEDGSIVKDAGSLRLTYGNLEGVEVNAGDEPDGFYVKGTGGGVPLSVNGGRGDDLIKLGDDAGTVDSILSRVLFRGEAGNNTIAINDQGDATGDVVHLARSAVGALPGDTLFGAGGSLVYNTTRLLVLNLGSGSDTVYAVPEPLTELVINDASGGAPVGGSPGPAGAPLASNDALYLGFAQAINPVLAEQGPGSGRYKFDNAQPLGYSGFESVKVDDVAPTIAKSFFSTAPRLGISFTFSEPVLFPPDEQWLILINANTRQTVSTAEVGFAYDPVSNTATFTFPKGLADGNYRARLIPGVPDLAGNAAVKDAVVDFSVLAGDANGDGRVDFGDLVVLAQNYNQGGKTQPEGDFNFDGKVDFGDLVILAQGYNRVLPKPVLGASAAEELLAGVTPEESRSAKGRPVFSGVTIHKPPAKKAAVRKRA